MLYNDSLTREELLELMRLTGITEALAKRPNDKILKVGHTMVARYYLMKFGVPPEEAVGIAAMDISAQTEGEDMDDFRDYIDNLMEQEDEEDEDY